MNIRFSVRAIQQGQTQNTSSVLAGAGQSGQAVVLQARANTKFQLTDVLTLTAPAKLRIKRNGQDLQVALPGGDIDMPDVVLKDYFSFTDVSLMGQSPTGEWMLYDTAAAGVADATPINGMAASKGVTAALDKAPGGGWFDGGLGLGALAAGGLGLAAIGGGGSSSSSSSTPAAGVSKITNYKSPTSLGTLVVSDYVDAEITGVTQSNLDAINASIKATVLKVDTKENIQKVVDAFLKISGEANGSAADPTTDDPTDTDYANIGVTLNLAASKPNVLALLNDSLKNLPQSSADSLVEIKTLVAAVEKLALIAEGGTATLVPTDLTALGIETTATNLAAITDAIKHSDDKGSAINTVAKVKAFVASYNTILAEANGTTADATVANPTAADYAAIGANIGMAKTDTDALARLNAVVGNLEPGAVDTVAEIDKLAATLEKIQTVAALATGVTLKDAEKFSADELKNLGLTGFSSSEANNNALALKVSEAIRDKGFDDVQAGDFLNGKLDAAGGRITWVQTQIERLQTLVSLEIIKNYKVDGVTASNTTPTPTATDWTNVGVFHNPATNTDAGNTKWTTLSAAEVASLNSVADKLDPAALPSSVELQSIADAYARITQEANGTAVDTNSLLTPLAADLAKVGVSGTAASGEGANLLLDIIANRSSTDVDTLVKLQALADTAAKVMQAAAGATASFTPAELSAIGLRGASAAGTSSNLADFVSHLKASNDNGTEVDTVAELQAFLSLAVVQAWARDVNTDITVSPNIAKTAATPTAQDYKDIGVVRSMPKNSDGTTQTIPALLSIADVAAINNAIDTLVDNLTNTAADDAKISSLELVRKVAASYFKILNEANSTASNFIAGSVTLDSTTDLNADPSSMDYENIGVEGTSGAGRTSLLNGVIGEKSFGSVDTTKEIRDLVTVVENVLTLADVVGISFTLTGQGLTKAELDSLALVGVTDANRDAVNLAIQNADVTAVDTLAELQSLVSLTRVLRYADDSSTTGNLGGEPTFADWKAIEGLLNETEANFRAYNSVVDSYDQPALVALGGGALAGLKEIVKSFNTVLAEADGNKTVDQTSGANPLLGDYTNLKLDFPSWAKLTDGGNASLNTYALHLLNNAVGGLTTDKVDSTTELQAIVDAAGRVILQAQANDTALTNSTGNPTGTLAVSAGLTKADLTMLGLDTSKIGNGNGSYDSHEFSNILAEIQNLSPSDAFNLATLQNKINAWALS